MNCRECVFFKPEQTPKYGECIISPKHTPVLATHYCSQFQPIIKAVKSK